MAYIIKENGVKKGPYPNRRGEFCGNHYLSDEPVHIIDEQAYYVEWLSKMRFGRPRPCNTGTTKELQQQGFVGLYLKADEPLLSNEIEVPTPEELKEPNESQSNN